MSSKQFSILLAIIVVALLVVVGYMVWGNNTQTDTLGQQNATTPSNLEDTNNNNTQSLDSTNSKKAENNTSGQTDETATWKTYRDTKHGFELKYPQDWTVTTENSPTSSLPLIVFKNTNGQISFVIGSECCREGVMKYAEKTVQIDSINEKYELYNVCKDLGCEEFTGQKLASLQIDTKYIKNAADYANGFGLWLEFSGAQETTALKSLDQILSTFKFIK
jgi:hypothetical protein